VFRIGYSSGERHQLVTDFLEDLSVGDLSRDASGKCKEQYRFQMIPLATLGVLAEMAVTGERTRWI
jgi:hypothetical protein